MKAYVFPGQGAQFVGMGKDLYDNSPLAKEYFEKANDILGFRITDLMFEGTPEDLKQTRVTHGVPAHPARQDLRHAHGQGGRAARARQDGVLAHVGGRLGEHVGRDDEA